MALILFCTFHSVLGEKLLLQLVPQNKGTARLACEVSTLLMALPSNIPPCRHVAFGDPVNASQMCGGVNLLQGRLFQWGRGASGWTNFFWLIQDYWRWLWPLWRLLGRLSNQLARKQWLTQDTLSYLLFLLNCCLLLLFGFFTMLKCQQTCFWLRIYILGHLGWNSLLTILAKI